MFKHNNNFSKEESIQLRDLLIKYKKEAAGPNDDDALDYFIDEIEKNQLEYEHSQLTSTQAWWNRLTREEQLELEKADGPNPHFKVKE